MTGVLSRPGRAAVLWGILPPSGARTPQASRLAAGGWGQAVRIGLLSDTHGNLAGLRAVAAALRREEPLAGVIVAGDLLGGGPRPRQVWEELTASGWTLVRGNDDEALAADCLDETTLAPGFRHRRAAAAAHAWTRAALGPAVPVDHWVATPAGALLVVHSSPRSLYDNCASPHNPAAAVTAAYAGTGAAAIAFGHYHQSFVRPLPFALLVNVASVGLPVDRLPLAAYTVLTATREGWIVEQQRVPYDLAEESAAAAAARAAGMPAWEPDAE